MSARRGGPFVNRSQPSRTGTNAGGSPNTCSVARRKRFQEIGLTPFRKELMSGARIPVFWVNAPRLPAYSTSLSRYSTVAARLPILLGYSMP